VGRVQTRAAGEHRLLSGNLDQVVVVIFERLRVDHQSEVDQLQKVDFQVQQLLFVDSADHGVVRVAEPRVVVEFHRDNDACESQPVDSEGVYKDLRVLFGQPVDVNQSQNKARL